MPNQRELRRAFRGAAILAASAWIAAAATPIPAADAGLPDYLADRGPGIPTSLFGTYVEKGDLMVYPFYEWTKTTRYEYKPSELGFKGEEDHLGETIEQEYLLFFGYGFSDRVIGELEGALYSKVDFDKASDDPSNVPSTITESGLGDVDMQVRWRWNKESADHPEYYSFVEATPPLQKNDHLIGTQEWEGGIGFGFIRGFSWGTLNGRVSMAYDGEDGTVEPGEFGIEYLKRVSSRWRLVGTFEGESDELSLIGEAQLFFNPNVFLKLNCGFGLTQKAPDLAPEVGVMFRI